MSRRKIPVSGCSLDQFKNARDGRRVQSERKSIEEQEEPNNIQDWVQFDSKWKRVLCQGTGPREKAGQSIVFSKERNCVYCCYGVGDGIFSDDFWQFDLKKKEWSKLNVENAKTRAFCSACLVGHKIWFFGGANENYNLHFLDLDTLKIVELKATGKEPIPTSSPFMLCYQEFLVIWTRTLNVLNTKTLEWEEIETGDILREGARGTVVGDTLYIIGVTVEKTILTMKLVESKWVLNVVRTTGIEPQDTEFLSIVSLQHGFIAVETREGHNLRCFLFVCGGMNWIRFSLALDEKVKNTDTSEALFYIQTDRKLLAIWKGEDPNSLMMSELHIGEPIALVNQKLDMLSMLQ